MFPLKPAPTINNFVGSGSTRIDLEYAAGTLVLSCVQLPDAPFDLLVNRLPLPAKLTTTVPDEPPVELHTTYGEPALAAAPLFATSALPWTLLKERGLLAIL